MLENIEELIESTNTTNFSSEEKEKTYRDIISQVVNILALLEISSDDEETQLIESCNAISEMLSQKFERDIELVEDDIFTALDEVPYDDLETSQELASRNMLN